MRAGERGGTRSSAATPAPELSAQRQLLGFAWAAVALPVVTALLVPHRSVESYATPVLLMLLAVVVGQTWMQQMLKVQPQGDQVLLTFKHAAHKTSVLTDCREDLNHPTSIDRQGNTVSTETNLAARRSAGEMFERRDRRNFRPARQRLRDADPKQRRQRQREALDLEAEIDRRMQQREHAGSSGDRAVDGGLGMAASRFEAMDKNPLPR